MKHLPRRLTNGTANVTCCAARDLPGRWTKIRRWIADDRGTVAARGRLLKMWDRHSRRWRAEIGCREAAAAPPRSEGAKGDR
jgi:hypothetical protein